MEGRVSPRAARDAYGVALVEGRNADEWRIDEAATAALRDTMRVPRGVPIVMIDRGPGYFALLDQGTGPNGV
jgi:hypothetical protein